MNDPLFLVGCPRSGTTLLAALLDRHSRFAVTPETAFFDDVAPRLTPERRLLQVLRSWRTFPELRIDAKDVVAQRPQTPAAVLAAILDLYANARGKARCAEPTPQHLRHAPSILRHLPQAKMICMLRDGRDNVLALHAAASWRGGLEGAAELWKDSLTVAEAMAAREPSRFLMLRFEDLLTGTDDVLRKALQFLGEPFENLQLDMPALNARKPPHRIGPRHASRRELARIEALLRDDLRRHGYPVA